jgi:exonuclease SbcC
MRAFGPYTDEQVLDFRLLGDRSFFLIHGPTGAGKSTILDAICFALYGETSGGDRQTSSMRSDHALPEAPTEVTFDFTLAGSHYRVTRCPDQERVRKRGGGTTRQRPAATLWKRSAHAGDSEEGTVLAAQWSRVTEEMERLLGFRSEQFRQVVMLPQGQFQRFLLAGSRDREQILEVLFQTEFYRHIEEALKESAKTVKAEYDDLKTRRQLILSQADVESEEELQAAAEEHAARLAELEGRILALRTTEREANDELNRGLETQMKIQEVEKAEKVVQSLRGGERGVRAHSFRLEQARRALQMRDAVTHAQEREKEMRAASKQTALAREKIEKATLESRLAIEALEAEKSREGQRLEARRRQDRLEQTRVQLEELTVSRKRLKITEQRQNRIGLLCESRMSALERARSKLRDELRPAYDAARQAESALEGRRLIFERTRRLYRLAVLHRVKAGSLAEVTRSRDDALKRWTEVQERLSRARTEMERMEARWMEGQASILADGLSEGSPCPVCGSTHHPFPARSQGDLPSEAAIKKARKAVKDLEQDHERTRHEADRLERMHFELETVVQNIRSEVRDDGVFLDPPKLKDRLMEVYHSLKEAQTAAVKLTGLAQAIEATERSESEIQGRLARLERGRSCAHQRREQLSAVLEDRLQRIPAELHDLKTLERHLETAVASLRRLHEALEKSQERFQAANLQLAAAREALEIARELEHGFGERFASAREALNQRLEEAGFPDLETCLVSMLREGDIAELETRIRTFHESMKAAEDRLLRARQATEGLTAPNIDELQERFKAAGAELTRCVGLEGGLIEKIKQTNGWLHRLRKTAREIEERERRFTVVGRIADTASGKNAHRITFQRFVLATLLDGVLETASSRLRLMSKGRFDLERARENADQRAAAGLDLLVYDSYTGTTRPVNTLSGGESFLASPALALGLADVVQAYAGGVRLETIFVDEGFGSLDPEALDLAFQTLLDLREGNRLVGIISHVPELRERVDVRLEVTPGRQGSTARFVL